MKDNPTTDMISQAIREMYLAHARLNGATVEWMTEVQSLSTGVLCQIISICYGKPNK